MPNDPNPIVQLDARARILVAGQAPGNLAHQSGRPFTDPSGVRLREWMGVSEAEFYDQEKVAILPMGFCFPGYDKHGGDMAPMKRCAQTWRAQVLEHLPNIGVTLLVGSYAQRWHLRGSAKKTLRETVTNWSDFVGDGIFTTPHPSWRNNAWLKANPWFAADVLPALQASVRSHLSSR